MVVPSRGSIKRTLKGVNRELLDIVRLQGRPEPPSQRPALADDFRIASEKKPEDLAVFGLAFAV
jgi:hypothetical protein